MILLRSARVGLRLKAALAVLVLGVLLLGRV
jgi:hypothetical protein